MPNKEKTNIARAPVVVVMGHIDHGKSTLLDHIRKTNIVEHEAGGITQHISAYEVTHKNEKGEDSKITFLDTPGHEAFSLMRARGAQIADIAILVVSAEDSVKTQTLEALQTIRQSNIPFIVAINKIDKPGANPEKTKMDLIEKEVYLEGFGGDVPYVEISAKIGTGVEELLSLILLVAQLQELKGDQGKNAEGFILESHLDTKRGISATLVIKDGSLKKGMFIVAGDALSGTRIFENFLGQPIESAAFSAPVRITGWNKLPPVGLKFQSFEKKAEAEKLAESNSALPSSEKNIARAAGVKLVPVILKADTLGSLEALEKELGKLEKEKIAFKIIGRSVGPIGETDLKLASSDRDAIILGFNVKTERKVEEANESIGILIKTFDTIYKLVEWLTAEVEQRRPRVEVMETTGKAKIQKFFSRTRDKQILGGKVYEGKLLAHAKVRIIRRENEIGEGNVLELQHNKQKVKEVEAGNEFGLQIESKIELAPGDMIESYLVVSK